MKDPAGAVAPAPPPGSGAGSPAPEGEAPTAPLPEHMSGLFSPTRARYLLLVAVLLLAGAFAGQIMHNVLLGSSWGAAMSRCLGEAPTAGTPAEFSDYLQNCTGPAEQRRALVSLAGASVVMALGVACLWVLPLRLLRRAGPMSVASAQWQEHAASVAAEMRVKRVPEVMWGSAWLNQPFTAGRPGRIRIVLPLGVRALPPAQADAILRHEVAHVAAGDVTLVWLTRGVWWALPPVLLVPAAGIVLQVWLQTRRNPLVPTFSHGFLWEYALRAGLLLAVAALVSQLVLRSREHEADLRSVRGRPTAGLEALLAGQPPRTRTWLQRGLANHPATESRLAVLRRAHLPLRVSLLDAAVIGLLSAMAMDAVTNMAETGFTGTPLIPYARLTGALVAGSLLAVGWGVAVWRGILADRAAAPLPRLALLVLGISMAAGLLVQLERTGTAARGSLFGWSLVGTVPLLTLGAGTLSVALARLWGWRRGGPHGSSWGWGAAVGANVALFVGALRIGQDGALFFAALGWSHVIDVIELSGLYSVSAASTALGLGGVALLALRSALRPDHAIGPPGLPGRIPALPGQMPGLPGRIPALPGQEQRINLYAVTLGGVAAAAAVATRWAVEPPLARHNAVYSTQFDWWTAVCAGLVCLVVLLTLHGAGGLGDALYAAPLATILAAGPLWARHATSWHHPWGAAEHYAIGPLAQLALFLLVLAVPAALLPTYRIRQRRATLLGALLTAALTTAAVLALLRSGTGLLELT
ncbi:hypothetical protein ACFPJ8_20215 [Streptomyces fildesensis]|uniref:hypothetical protein n=2 Tax=Streptomyces TaxID=1883 RepID=UPI0018DF0E46|nr:hypothetical protein [Streptomyces fildesensis]